jgi:hypothetical protein
MKSEFILACPALGLTSAVSVIILEAISPMQFRRRWVNVSIRRSK